MCQFDISNISACWFARIRYSLIERLCFLGVFESRWRYGLWTSIFFTLQQRCILLKHDDLDYVSAFPH